jgi:type IV pilus assembly protein PilE
MSKHARSRNINSAGFTLIELMVTVAIVAILATIAVTSYKSQIQKSRRTDAKSAVLDLAGREERLFSTTNAYSSTPSALGYTGAAFPILVGSGYYTVNVQVPDPNPVPANPASYLITATAAGSQASDAACATFTVNQLGVQGSTGTGTVPQCWGN